MGVLGRQNKIAIKLFTDAAKQIIEKPHSRQEINARNGREAINTLAILVLTCCFKAI